MKKLSNSELETMKELLETYDEKSSEVDRLYILYVDAVSALNEKIADLNGAASDLESFRQSIFDQMEDYFDGKSENWQDGDTGSSYRDWMDEWSNASVYQMDEVEEQGIDIPDVSLFEEISTEFQG